MLDHANIYYAQESAQRKSCSCDGDCSPCSANFGTGMLSIEEASRGMNFAINAERQQIFLDLYLAEETNEVGWKGGFVAGEEDDTSNFKQFKQAEMMLAAAQTASVRPLPTSHENVDEHYDCETSLCEPGTHSDSVNIDETCEISPYGGITYKGLILMAWCILNENLDLVEESLNAFGFDGSQVEKIITGDRWLLGNVKIKCEDIEGTAKALGHLDLIKLDTSYLQYLAERYDDASEFTGVYKRKGHMCVVCDLAGTILHEVTHLAWIAVGDSATGNRTSYAIENYFRYWITYRYCVLGWGCCDWSFGGDGTYENLLGEKEVSGITKEEVDDSGRTWFYSSGVIDQNREAIITISTGNCDNGWPAEFSQLETTEEEEEDSEPTRDSGGRASSENTKSDEYRGIEKVDRMER